jgi:NAD-dependent dihydropyrimidine dehydrogenase PreA subunit
MRRWLRGYRGFFREMLKTGGLSALRLQVRTGVLHGVRSLRRRRPDDPVALFLANYGADGVRLPDPAARPLALAAQACVACGLCSLECARVGGRPRLDPRDAVLAGSRLEIDWLRLGLAGRVGDACAGCRACEAVCPVHIPIAAVQARLAEPGRGAPGGPSSL